MNRTPVGSIVRRSLRRLGIVLGAGVVVIASNAMRDDARAQQRSPSARPNIVLMFPDNLGWGEVNVYGGVRGAITPRLDRLAAEGLRLNNFNVEFSCTVSRAALLTGRYAVRTGATQAFGITLWEVTIAEALQSIGYSTALFGKWHLGGNRAEQRNPSQQGFDEYYGIPRTSNEAQTTIANRPRRASRSWSAPCATRSRSSSTTR
jgi:arylsulfatase A-like enzyme